MCIYWWNNGQHFATPRSALKLCFFFHSSILHFFSPFFIHDDTISQNNFTWYFIFRQKTTPLTREVPGAWSLIMKHFRIYLFCLWFLWCTRILHVSPMYFEEWAKQQISKKYPIVTTEKQNEERRNLISLWKLQATFLRSLAFPRPCLSPFAGLLLVCSAKPFYQDHMPEWGHPKVREFDKILFLWIYHDAQLF